MTIAIVLEVFLPIVNGVITTTLNLAENLQKRGHRVIFIVPAWKEFDKPKINGIAVHYISSAPSHMYPGIRFVSPWNHKVEKILINEKVDILQITGPWLLSLAAMNAAHRNNIPVLHVFHTLIYEDTYIRYGVKIKWLIPLTKIFLWKYIGMFLNKSDIITAPSKHACNTIKAHFPNSTVRHVLNGIDLAKFQNNEDFKSLNSKYPYFNHKTFLFVGRLGEEKSVSILLEAFYKAHIEDPEIILIIIGDGPGRRDYEKIVKKNSLEHYVFFLGRLPHEELIHSGLIHHARAMVTASITENQPITIIEAIACNTPIIIPDVDGINELLLNNGSFFPKNDTKIFAERILELACNEEQYQSYTRKGKEFRKKFGGMKIAEQFEELFAEVIEAKKK